MGCLFTFFWCGTVLEKVCRLRGFFLLDGGGSLIEPSEFFEHLHLAVDKIRIPEILISIRKRSSHHLGEQMVELRCLRIGFVEREVTEHAVHLGQANAARGWRGHRNGIALTHRETDGLSLHRSICQQVLGADDSTTTLHLHDDVIGDLSVIEARNTLLDDGLESSGEVQLHEVLAGGDGGSSRVEHLFRRLEAEHSLFRSGQHPLGSFGHRKSVSGQRQSRFDHLLARHASPFFLGSEQTGDRSRNPRGEVSHQRGFFDARFGCTYIHIGSGGSWRHLTEIECDFIGSTRSSSDGADQESSTSQVSRCRIGHCQRKSDRHCCIDGVPAGI